MSVKIRDDEGPSVGSFGHRGARRTVMWVDPTNGLAIVLLVERFDMNGEEQKVMYESVMKAAIAKYGRATLIACASSVSPPHQATISFTTSPATSVRRKSRPLKR